MVGEARLRQYLEALKVQCADRNVEEENAEALSKMKFTGNKELLELALKSAAIDEALRREKRIEEEFWFSTQISEKDMRRRVYNFYSSKTYELQEAHQPGMFEFARGSERRYVLISFTREGEGRITVLNSLPKGF